MTRFVGYLERRPYLWFVDVEAGDIDPAAELEAIPQGIDEVVPLENAVAVRCGPTWFGLEADLSGHGRALTASEQAMAKERSVQLDVPEASVYDRELLLPHHDGKRTVVTHERVAYWYNVATWSPERRMMAIGGSTRPFDAPTGPVWAGSYNPRPSVLAFFDPAAGTVTTCEGTFENFCYPPAWSSNGDLVVIGVPFEPRRLYAASPEQPVLKALTFQRHVPAPLLDSRLLPHR